MAMTEQLVDRVRDLTQLADLLPTLSQLAERAENIVNAVELTDTLVNRVVDMEGNLTKFRRANRCKVLGMRE